MSINCPTAPGGRASIEEWQSHLRLCTALLEQASSPEERMSLEQEITCVTELIKIIQEKKNDNTH